MALMQNMKCYSVPTSTGNASLTTKQNYAVTADSNGYAILATAAKSCLGFLQNDPLAGETATVAFDGMVPVAITDTITSVMAPLEIASGGTLVNHASGVIVAYAAETGVTGNIISVYIARNNGLMS